MESIRARDLRNDYARVLREVEAGASYTITNHGRPVAQITPLGSTSVGPRDAVPFGEVAGALAHLPPAHSGDLHALIDGLLDPEPRDPFSKP